MSNERKGRRNSRLEQRLARIERSLRNIEHDVANPQTVVSGSPVGLSKPADLGKLADSLAQTKDRYGVLEAQLQAARASYDAITRPACGRGTPVGGTPYDIVHAPDREIAHGQIRSALSEVSAERLEQRWAAQQSAAPDKRLSSAAAPRFSWWQRLRRWWALRSQRAWLREILRRND